MHKHPDLTRRRIESFLNETLRPRCWHEHISLDAAVYQPPFDARRDYRRMEIAPAHAAQFTYQPVEPGFAWGPVWSDAWFLLTGTVPAEWKGKRVVARIAVGAEAILWDGDTPVQGLDNQHREVALHEKAAGGESVSLHVQATGMNPNVSVHGKPQEPSATPFTFQQADLAIYEADLWGLYHDMNVALGVMREQPADSPRYGQLLAALNDAVNLYAEDDADSIAAARRRLAETYARPANASAHQLRGIGHSHLDLAWLWPIERTQMKAIHTCATAIRLLDQYPEFTFTCSQPAMYEWVKRMAPKLYARIQDAVKQGRWEVAGSMWVEPDCNLASGESLVRQVLLGKNFFLDEFGVETRDLWLPDVFGYAAALPQILKKARVDYFMTTKMGWNQFNTFPHRLFLWEGLDGTQIFTHLPVHNNADVTPAILAQAAREFGEYARANRSLLIFGHGDGGGGPTVEMLENARRLTDVEGMPKLEIGHALDFFRKLEEEAKNLPVWVGELYLELHRGTYTTQARCKRDNRKAEFALRDAEFLSVVNPTGLAVYPLSQLDRAWKTTLLNQFHDILPGSSISEVYADSAQDYAEVSRVTEEIITSAVDTLAGAIQTTGVKRPVLILSNLSHFANEAVEVPLRAGENPAAAVGPQGEIMPVQINTTADGKRAALFVARNLPLHGYAVWDLNATSVAPDEEESVTASTTHLENESVRVEFDAKTGLITRLFDKDSEREILNDTVEVQRSGKRDVIVSQCANQFQLFEDKPLFWDAWDIDLFYQEKPRTLTELAGVEVVENGPVRGAIRFMRQFGASQITQIVRLTQGSARIDFVTEIDWHETDTLLKVAFPVAIHSPRATYEIQYGHTERPTHYNTSWDMARFEVCAHKWADLSEGDYGVALLNDCKYGHDIFGNVMRLTLLRAPVAPDPDADRGHHVFTYSLLPHGGDFRDGEVVENAYAINCPPRVRALTGNQSGTLPLERSFFEVDNASVFIEAIKRAEKEAAVILRLYEAHNTRGTVTLTTTLPVKKAYLCDIMESNVAEIPVANGEMLLPIQPFEIVTVKLTL